MQPIVGTTLKRRRGFRSGMAVCGCVAAAATVRRSAAIGASRLAARACALAGRGGTSLPGLVALRVDPDLVRALASQLGGGSVVIAGTNGKTTTSALVASALRAGGRRVVHNRAGSNMLRGIAATLARRATWSGRVRGGARFTGVFEVDEAAFAGVVAQLAPRVVVILNLFRDQLDRYAEVATTAARWRAALAALPPTTTVVLNADDALVASLAEAARGPVVFYGVESWPEKAAEDTTPRPSADTLYCPRCGGQLTFTLIAYSHLGHYRCAACGPARPTPYYGARVKDSGAAGSLLRLCGGNDTGSEVRLTLPGRYNVYNAVAALATADLLGVEGGVAAAAVEATPGVFGRAESIAVDGREVRLFLIKNPTGADAVLDVVAAGGREAGLLCLLSDRAADGEDVSWIWDVRFDLLSGWTGPITCGGTRGEDMALRLKYAGLPAAGAIVPGDVGRAVDAAVAATPSGSRVLVLATYTAMLAARDHLARAGHVRQYWRR